LAEELIDGGTGCPRRDITREHDNEIGDAELKWLSEIKANFDLAIKMIESGEAD